MKKLAVFFVMSGMILFTALPLKYAIADQTHMWPVLTDVRVFDAGHKATMTWTTYPVTLTEAELDTKACNSTPCYLDVFNRVDGSRWDRREDLTNFSFIYALKDPGRPFTWRELFSLNIFTPGTKTVISPNYEVAGSCFRMGLMTNLASSGGVWPLDFPWSRIHTKTSVPPGVAPVNSPECIGTPPSSEWCAPETQNLDFDFGLLSASAAPTAQRKKDIVIKCTSAIKFKLHLHQQNEIPGSINLSNGMKALVKANGVDLHEAVHQGINGNSSLPLTVSLTGEANSTGFFEGSGVLGISYP